MPTPGEKDTGGNPLQEGIFGQTDGGFKNRMVRDETFASIVHRASIPDGELDYHLAAEFDIEQVIEPGPKTVEVDAPGQPIILQHKDQGVLDAAKARMEAALKEAGPELAIPVALEGAGLAADALGAGEVGGALTGAGSASMGAITGLLGKVPGLMKSVFSPGNLTKGLATHEVMNALDGGNGGGGAGAPAGDYGPPPRGLEQLSHMMFGEFEHPSSQPHIPSDDTSDPEKVDPHEKNDGDNKDWEKDLSVDGTGGSNGPFTEQSPGVIMIMENMPLVQGYANDPHNSGEHDPIIQAIHQALEGEHPGYLQSLEDEPTDDLLAGKDPEGDSEPHKEEPKEEKEAHIKLAEGPHTAEQFEAVMDLLRSTGRGDEVQNLISHPDDYTKELAMIQGQQEMMPSGQPDQPPPPPMPPQEQTPPGAGMPMPPPPTGIQPMGRVAADNIAPICPKCKSHTTGIINNDGECKCQACGNIFKDKALSSADGSSTHHTVTARWSIIAMGEHDEHAHENTFKINPADRVQPENVEHEQDSSLSWKDAAGAPLKVGSEYALKSDKYEIPDYIRVEAVKPDAIDFTITGEYGLASRHQLSRQEAQLEGSQFIPQDGQDAELGPAAPELQQPGDADGSPNQTSDMADSHEYGLTASTGREWLREAGASFTGYEQRQFIDEPGVARNIDKLDLSHTHYLNDDDVDDAHFLW